MREIQVEVDPRRLDALDLPLASVAGTLAAENLDVPAGQVQRDGRDVSLRTKGEFTRVGEIGDLILRSSGGSAVRVRDVAVVRDGFEDRATTTRLNGVDAVSFAIRKQAGGNTAVISAHVVAAVDKAARLFPEFQITTVYDDAKQVHQNVSDVRFNMELGEDAMTAARRGTAEIGLAVMATTFTLLAVFLPVAFMQGLVGQFFKEFGLAVAFIYIVLASQFESFLEPFLIMLSLLLALVGAILLLLVTRQHLGLPAMIGIVMLMGLVTKNAILLVDHTNQRRREGLEIEAAILAAGPVRLRPILMTTSAMILGMLPAAFGLGEGGEIRAPMALATIGGLITSTLLTLVPVPVGYLLLARMTGPGRRWRSRWASPSRCRCLRGPGPRLVGALRSPRCSRRSTG